MALVFPVKEKEQVEILHPDGTVIKVIVVRPEGRSYNNIRIAIIAPKEIKIERRTRLSKEENQLI